MYCTDTLLLLLPLVGVQVKLLMVGSASRLRAGVPLLAHMLDWVQGKDSIMKLPADALGSSS
jgi:hypothetical protein